MKEKFIYIAKFLISFLLFYFIGDIFKIVLDVFDISISSNGNIILQFICSGLMFIVLLLLYKNDINEEFGEAKKKPKEIIGNILKMFLIFVVIKFLMGIISSLLLVILKMDVSSLNSINQMTIEKLVKINPVLLLISSTFLGPVYEEILFRMGIKKIFNNKYLFIIFSGLLFGLLHIFPLGVGVSLELGLIQSLTYVITGMFFAYIYEKTGNIANNIGVHFLNNLLSILILINRL